MRETNSDVAICVVWKYGHINERNVLSKQQNKLNFYMIHFLIFVNWKQGWWCMERLWTTGLAKGTH
jgi:hypothetical protein